MEQRKEKNEKEEPKKFVISREETPRNCIMFKKPGILFPKYAIGRPKLLFSPRFPFLYECQ